MKAVRRPLFWYNLAMWVLSLVISSLLIQLGALVMSDVPTAGNRITRDDFVDQAQLTAAQARIEGLEAQQIVTANETEDAQFVLRSRSLDYQNQRASFETWVQTRTATASDTQNAEVVARVQAIEALKLEERDAERAIEGLEQQALQTERDLRAARADRGAVLQAANAPYDKARQVEVLKVFGLRLAMALPLLLIAAWMVMKKRASPYWPVYRGFTLFALFAFFVELVPYLPSYGGYVRTIVGIVLALAFVRFATQGMSRYLERKKNEEQRPETEKRQLIAYETAVKKISDGQCPSCDRQFAAKPARRGAETAAKEVDYCVHCGFCLFNKCGNCGTRENSFFKFCGACGVPTGRQEAASAV